MLWAYATKVVSHSVRDFHIRTDIWYAAVSVAISGFSGTADAPVGELTPNEIAWYVLIAVAAFAGLRMLVLSPYRIWRDSQINIKSLETQLDSPRQKIIAGMSNHRISCYREMSESVARLSMMARAGTKIAYAQEDITEELRSCAELMEQIRVRTC